MEKKSSWLKNFIISFDIYYNPLSIFFKNKVKYKTYFGGILSIICICLIIFLSISELWDVASKKDQIFLENKLRYREIPEITLSLNNKDKLKFFFFAFSFMKGSKEYVELKTIEKYLDFEIMLKNITKTDLTRKEEVLRSYKLEKCCYKEYFKNVYSKLYNKQKDESKPSNKEDIIIDSNPNKKSRRSSSYYNTNHNSDKKYNNPDNYISNLDFISNNDENENTKKTNYNNNFSNSGKSKRNLENEDKLCEDIPFTDESLKFINNLYCINDDELILKGNFLSPEFIYFSFKLKKFNNESKFPNYDEELEKFIRDLKIDVHYTKIFLNLELINQIPITHSITVNSNKISNILYQKVDLYLSKNHFSSFENIFFKFINVIRSYYVSFNEKVLNYSHLSNTFYSFYLRSDEKYIKYARNYSPGIAFISQVGGMWKFISIIISFIVIRINLKIMAIQIANSIFNVVSPDRMISLNNENYDYYLKIGSGGQLNELIKSNNKSTLEARMSIDLYKYQRISGIEYSIKDEFLKKFNCCFKRNKNNKHNYEFTDLLIIKILKKLDIIKILKFSKNIQNCIKIFLMKKHLLLKNQKMGNIIDYRTIKDLTKFINKKRYRLLSKIPIETLEPIFLKGIRYLKNKPIHNSIIDKKLVDRLFSDKDKINEKRKVFMQYYNKNRIFFLFNFVHIKQPF